MKTVKTIPGFRALKSNNVQGCRDGRDCTKSSSWGPPSASSHKKSHYLQRKRHIRGNPNSPVRGQARLPPSPGHAGVPRGSREGAHAPHGFPFAHACFSGAPASPPSTIPLSVLPLTFLADVASGGPEPSGSPEPSRRPRGAPRGAVGAGSGGRVPQPVRESGRSRRGRAGVWLREAESAAIGPRRWRRRRLAEA